MSQSALADNQKLKVTYRVEPGCLGPSGNDHVDKFCNFSQSILDARTNEFYICWEILPRRSQLEPEIEYSVDNKRLGTDMVIKYLAVFDQTLEAFQDSLDEQLTGLVERYMKRS